jgi:peptidoglycan hydrolase FlgJ
MNQPLQPLQLSSPALAPPRGRDAAATAQEFEAVFLGQMAQLMLESAEIAGEFSGGHGEQMFRGVLAEKLGAAFAGRGGVGLAPAVMKQIIMMQEGTGNAG